MFCAPTQKLRSTPVPSSAPGNGCAGPMRSFGSPGAQSPRSRLFSPPTAPCRGSASPDTSQTRSRLTKRRTSSHCRASPRGSALVTYEALACGLPVVTTRNAGSVVRDGEEGFIVPARDAEAPAARLEELRTKVSDRRSMAAAARARVEQFSWDRYGRSLAEALAQTIEQCQAAAACA
jgi:hypothetical protein